MLSATGGPSIGEGVAKISSRVSVRRDRFDGGPGTSVQPCGKPMSDSTHAGLSGPGCCVRITSESGRAFRSSVSGEALPLFQSRAVGVGQADSNGLPFTAPISVGLPRAYVESPRCPSARTGVGQWLTLAARDSPCVPARCDGVSFVCRFSFGEARGVGHGNLTTASVSVVLECRPLFVEYACTPLDLESIAVAVGQKEPPLPSVRRAHIGRSKHVPFSSVPERGQGPENFSEGGSIPGRKKPRNVLQEDEAGSKFANDPRVFRPEPPLVFLRLAAPCERDRLTGEASAHEVDAGEIAPPGESHIVNSASCAGPVSRED